VPSAFVFVAAEFSGFSATNVTAAPSISLPSKVTLPVTGYVGGFEDPPHPKENNVVVPRTTNRFNNFIPSHLSAVIKT
jgi:hypothetical protein